MSSPSYRCLTSLVAALVHDDRGDDMVEYALLSALIGLSGLAIYSLSTKMGTAYVGWDTNQQSIWTPCAPLPATCP
jgi:Flp pilus assembly pilin Flp